MKGILLINELQNYAALLSWVFFIKYPYLGGKVTQLFYKTAR